LYYRLYWYTYALNNPLIYTDPSGEFLQYILGAIIGDVVNLGMNADNIDNLWQALGYFSVGAASGAPTAAVGVGLSSMVRTIGFKGGAIIGSATGFAGGFSGGTCNALIGGVTFGNGLKSGAIGGLIGGVIGGY